MPVLAEMNHGKVPVKLWSPLVEVESNALTQLANISRLPFVYKHIAVMPDVHVGRGATVGSVIASENMVIPAAVGLDIGCGMAALKTNLDPDVVTDKVQLLRHRIENEIPLGPESHKKTSADAEKWKGWRAFDRITFFTKKTREKAGFQRKALSQLGTLGGGNHFIEICLDEDRNVWLMLHSGSRNIGKKIAERHIAEAKKLNLVAHEKLPGPDLAYFLEHETEFQAYWHDLMWAQDYALENRKEMVRRILKVLKDTCSRKAQMKIELEVHCHHNYVAQEYHFGDRLYVTRKGATRAGENEYGIIPGSMGVKSYIVKGKGNPESFFSCSHGAGRRLSRGRAKSQFTVADLEAQTEGVECRKDFTVLDEIPGAYKDIDQVMANQEDLVSVVATLKQILCVKG